MLSRWVSLVFACIDKSRPCVERDYVHLCVKTVYVVVFISYSSVYLYIFEATRRHKIANTKPIM